MRTIIASQLVTIDGMFEGPNKEFVPPPWNTKLDKYSEQLTNECDTILYGRVSFEFNRDFWQAAKTDPRSPAAQLPVAPRMNAMEKLVLSRTLPENPGWNGRTIRHIEEVTAAKHQDGKPIVIFGSGLMMEALMKHDLIDEYRFMINPLIMGGGAPMFRGGHPRYPLKLISCEPLDTGVLLTRYVRVR